MKNKGITLISVIITIIVILILAGIAIYNGYGTPESASFTNFTDIMDNVRLEIGTIRANNFADYRDKERGFALVTIEDAPEDFVSASKESGEIKGYLIDMEKLSKRIYFAQGTPANSDVVVFDEDDVLVYDKNGTVYYAKGYPYKDRVFYNATNSRAYSETYAGAISSSNSVYSMAKSGKLQVGQYVEYIYDDADAYELPASITGYVEDEVPQDQQIAQIKNLEWRIWNVNDDGSVDLVGNMKGSKYANITFMGAEGYNNGVFLLNDICKKHYSNETLGIKARNIKKEDIEKLYNEDGINARNNYQDRKGKYGETFTYSGTKTYPILMEKEKGMGIGTTSVATTGINNSDSYFKSLEEITAQSIQTKTTNGGVTMTIDGSAFTVTQLSEFTGRDSDMLYNGKPYWVATRGHGTYGSAFPYLSIGYLTFTGYTGNTLYTGSGANKSVASSIRPIVTIKPTLKVSNADSVDGSSSSQAWKLEK